MGYGKGRQRGANNLLTAWWWDEDEAEVGASGGESVRRMRNARCRKG
jgi:hypothetical protein